VRRAFAVLAVLAAVWGAVVLLLDGVALSVGPLRLSSSDSIRPLVTAAAAAMVYFALSGQTAAREDARWLRRALTPQRVALLLTSVVTIVGVVHNSWAVGGSDSYSYGSQMDLWLRGGLKVPVTMASEVPWPDALATFTPFGYAAVAREAAIAPITPPGLPLLMAALKSIANHAAAFLVVPLTGGLLVWSTFLIGRRLGSDRLGLAAAWLVATSPTFLMMFKSQMSDVPAAAFWALATYWIAGTTVSNAAAAGLAASVAILIRPNLLPLAAVFAGWTMIARPRSRLAAFALATLPGCVAVAAINSHLFGSPLTSGYGDLSSLFATENIDDTISSYFRWLVETQTPLVFAGIGILAIAPSRLLPPAHNRGAMRLLAWLTVTTWVVYAAYPAFDAWWFLRFLLPSWPAMFIGTAALVIWLFDHRGARGRASTVVVVIARRVRTGGHRTAARLRAK
jgi:Dolichyl-phosphate-mannose-protein mannosyltransferase